MFKLNDNLIAWNSQSQKWTAVSTTEAEYIAACAATKEVVWLRRLLETFSINFTKPTLICSNNQSAICLVKDPEFQKRTKHVDIQYHFIRGQFQGKVIDLEYIPTTLQTADILTKALPHEPFELFRNHLQWESIHKQWEYHFNMSPLQCYLPSYYGHLLSGRNGIYIIP